MSHEISSLIFRTILTTIVYVLANYHTYNVGIQQNEPPLQDVMHDMLPNLSKMPYIRDACLPLFLIPMFFIANNIVRQNFIFDLWNSFLIIVTLKAITIFFTFVPPSNTYCHQTRQINHAYHQIFSGHNSFVFLLYLLYVKYGAFNASLMNFLPFMMYSFLILITRCHYSVDILVSYIIVYLLVT
jgi:hypothetical protein